MARYIQQIKLKFGCGKPGWDGCVFKTYPLDKLSGLRTTGPSRLRQCAFFVNLHASCMYLRRGHINCSCKVIILTWDIYDLTRLAWKFSISISFLQFYVTTWKHFLCYVNVGLLRFLYVPQIGFLFGGICFPFWSGVAGHGESLKGGYSLITPVGFYCIFYTALRVQGVN